MFNLNLFLNILVIIGLFIVDGITSNVLGVFALILILLLPKIRGILLKSYIKTNLYYEILEFLLNAYLIVVIGRSLFDTSVHLNNYEIYTYSYFVIRILIVILILILFNLILWRSKSNKKIDIDDLNFGYITLFVSIFNVYFGIKYQQHFNTVVSIILCCLNIFFCYKLIEDLNYKNSGLFYSLIISILGILTGNEILLLVIIKTFITTYKKDKIRKIVDSK